MGAKITSNLTALYFFCNAKAIPKKICLASYLLSLFFERNQFLEPTFINIYWWISDFLLIIFSIYIYIDLPR